MVTRVRYWFRLPVQTNILEFNGVVLLVVDVVHVDSETFAMN